MGERGLGHERSADDIGVEDLPPGLGVHVGQCGERADGRRVDERIDPAHLLGRLVDGRSARRGVGDVARDRHRARAGLLRGRLEPLEPACQQRGLRSSLGQANPDAAAQPARRPDDDGPHPGFLP